MFQSPNTNYWPLGKQLPRKGTRFCNRLACVARISKCPREHNHRERLSVVQLRLLYLQTHNLVSLQLSHIVVDCRQRQLSATNQ